MRKFRILKLFVLVCILAAALVFIGMNFVQAQSQTKGKPDKPPDKGGKPPKIDCNNNGICESGEYDRDADPENQPCADCLPKIYPPLEIDQIGKQIVCTGSGFYSWGKSYQYRYVNDSEYADTWESDSIETSDFKISIGDIDNDGEKEIAVVGVYFIRSETSGKGKNKVTVRYYDHKIFIYESGSLGEPVWESPFLGETPFRGIETVIADADNDGTLSTPDNELVLLKEVHLERSYIEIFEWNVYENGMEWTSSSPVFETGSFSCDVGDADNDGENEILLPLYAVGYVVVFEFDKTGGWSWVETETIDAKPSEISSLMIDCARPRDVDNVEGNEIVAGGNNNKLMIWKYIDGSYKSVFVSEDLGGWTPGVDAGDINGDGYNEVIVGADQVSRIYVFRFNSGVYENLNSIYFDNGTADVRVGDIDHDGRDEIVVVKSDLKVFDFFGDDIMSGYLELTFSHPYAGLDIEID